MHTTPLAQLGEWQFYKATDHGFGHDRPLYGYDRPEDDKPRISELYNSLEHAMVAAVGEKYTGSRGAGGTGVGTAADWFMKMIGAEQLVPVEKPNQTMMDALANSRSSDGPLYRRAIKMIELLEAKGFMLATWNKR